MSPVAPGVKKEQLLVVVCMDKTPTVAGRRWRRASVTINISPFVKVPVIHLIL